MLPTGNDYLAAWHACVWLGAIEVPVNVEYRGSFLEHIVRDSGATTVFAEPLVSAGLAETVAREAGVEVVTLDPIEGLSEARLDAGEDYLSVMRANLAALREALGCR